MGDGGVASEPETERRPLMSHRGRSRMCSRTRCRSRSSSSPQSSPGQVTLWTQFTTMETRFLLLTVLLGLSTGGKNVVLKGPDCSGMTSVRLQRRGSGKYVDFCRDGHPILPEDQDPLFVDRVEGLKCPMQDGVVSTTLKNVTREDAGEYEWFCKNTTRNSSSTVYLNVTDGGAADGNATPGNATPGNATPGNATPGNATPGNATPGNATPGNATPGNATPGNPQDVGAITGQTVGVGVGVVLGIIVLYLCRSKFRCRVSDQKRSVLPVTYEVVNQQQSVNM